MPVYNSGEYLKTAVDSILNQSLQEIELILVDDGSTDGSADRCDEYARQDRRVVVIHQKNSGICAARNAALDIARGEYIGFSDHDDEYGENQLFDNYWLGANNGADIVKFGSSRVILNNGVVAEKKDRKFWDASYTRDEIKENFFMLWRHEVYNGVWDALFKRDFIKMNNIRFDTYYTNGGEDFDFNWLCISKLHWGGVIYLNKTVYYNHYLRTGFSTSSKFNDYSIKVSAERPQKLFSHVKSLNIDIEREKAEYTYFWLRMCLGGVCHFLALPQCDWSKEKKVNTLRHLMEDSFFKKWILKQPPFSIRRIASKQYMLLLWLYQHRLYSICIRLYQIQFKRRGIS